MIRSNTRGSILTFVLGAGIGAVIGLLLAWKTGEKLRDDISGKVKQARRKAESLVADAKDRVDEVAGEVVERRQ
jgi:gas vesicle protein